MRTAHAHKLKSTAAESQKQPFCNNKADNFGNNFNSRFDSVADVDIFCTPPSFQRAAVAAVAAAAAAEMGL